MLSLPPFGALARVSGPGPTSSSQRLAAAGPDAGLDIGQGGRPGDDHHVVRAADWMTLGARLIATERPAGFEGPRRGRSGSRLTPPER